MTLVDTHERRKRKFAGTALYEFPGTDDEFLSSECLELGEFRIERFLNQGGDTDFICIGVSGIQFYLDSKGEVSAGREESDDLCFERQSVANIASALK